MVKYQLKMTQQSWQLVCILAISYITLGSNFVVITSDVASDKTKVGGQYRSGKTLKDFESSKSLHKRNTYEDFGNLDLYYKSTTKESKSKVWFQFNSPTPGNVRRETSQDRVRKDNDEVQGLRHGHDANFINGTIKNPSLTIGNSSNTNYTISHVGCFSTWEKQYTQLQMGSEAFDDTQLHITCANKCLQKGEQMQIIFLKGAECQCAPIYAFDSKMQHDSYCNIPCPLKDFYPSTSKHEYVEHPCGGNEGYSVYCVSGPENCSDVLEKAESDRRRLENQHNRLNETESRLRPVAVLQQICAKCEAPQMCIQPYFHPDFDYFPVNSPDECVEYCGSKVPYVVIGQQERERPPTQYALLMWWKHHLNDLPMCRCIDESVRQMYVEVKNTSVCNMTCPGKLDTLCGGMQQDQVYFATVYCVDYFDGRCERLRATTTILPAKETDDPCSDDNIDCDDSANVQSTTDYTTQSTELPETTEDPTSTTQDPTSTTQDPTSTTQDPTSTTQDPTSTTQDPTSTTQDPTSTTQDPTQTTEDPTQTTGDPTQTTGYPTQTTEDPTQTTEDPTQTTEDPTQTTEDPTQTTEDPTQTTKESAQPSTDPTTSNSSTSSTPSSTTTLSSSHSPVTTTTYPAFCSIKCQAFDRLGYYWEVCAGHEKIVSCAELNNNSTNVTGLASWRCSNFGNFQTSQPNVSNCTSAWLEEKNEEIKLITDIEGANSFVDRLAEACRDAVVPNSPTKYFGHEITSVTSLVALTVKKAVEFYSNATFTDLESVIDKAVDLYAFLIQYHDPWKDLPLPERSAISSNTIDNIEESVFNLTQKAHDQDSYKRFFQLSDLEENKFLILAEMFDKWNNNLRTKSYEFPPKTIRDKYDSYIKLPDGWDNLVPSEHVEIAAMSIDSKYISRIMPGQYRYFVSSSTLGESGSNAKLINGRLLSFTLMSAETGVTQQSQKANSIFMRPITSFTGKGVEITFHHDIEAWGKDIQNVPRDLHDGELPKAVLGSSECVFWDTETLKWSSKGCKILRANRHETVCECNHLTSFAILMDVHRYVGKEFGLKLLTLILCPASEIALVISIIILSSVNGLQRIRATITKNLSACLLVGNLLVLFVLDRNYFNMNEGVCVTAAIITHYVFLCAFMWMLVEGIQLYRMVVHVFDSGRSYIRYFGIFAYSIPLLVIAITATTGYLKGDKPYGGDVYCWLEGPYIWSFMGPVALVTVVNFVILFIALRTAYRVNSSKKHSQLFIMGRMRSCKTWFKGCFSLTVILGLTWVVGFFTLMKSPGGIIAAYIFTILNASQGLFIFFFNCVFNEKVRAFTRCNLSTYLPSWLSSSISSNPETGGNNASFYGKGKRHSPSLKTGDSELHTKNNSQNSADPPISHVPVPIDMKARSKIRMGSIENGDLPSTLARRSFVEAKNTYVSVKTPVHRQESTATFSSFNSTPNLSLSEAGAVYLDNSQSALISNVRF